MTDDRSMAARAAASKLLAEEQADVLREAVRTAPRLDGSVGAHWGHQPRKPLAPCLNRLPKSGLVEPICHPLPSLPWNFGEGDSNVTVNPARAGDLPPASSRLGRIDP